MLELLNFISKVQMYDIYKQTIKEKKYTIQTQYQNDIHKKSRRCVKMIEISLVFLYECFAEKILF